MFCPNCRDEFRAGFTECAKCEVALVEKLIENVDPSIPKPNPHGDAVPTIRYRDYCGFFAREDAEQAGATLNEKEIPWEVVARRSPGLDPHAPSQDEFWLRVDSQRIKEAATLLELDEAELEEAAEAAHGAADAHFDCSECGEPVAENESFCPHCGERFED